MRAAGRTLACLHVNHKLRGRDAEDDQVFVAALAEALDIPFFCCEVDVALLARETGGNVEAIGRQERYIAAREASRASACTRQCPSLKDASSQRTRKMTA